VLHRGGGESQDRQGPAVFPAGTVGTWATRFSFRRVSRRNRVNNEPRRQALLGMAFWLTKPDAQFLTVCSRLKWSRHLTKSPGCLLAMAGSSAAYKIELYSALWYDAPLTSRDSDRRHHPWPVYGSLTCSSAPPIPGLDQRDAREFQQLVPPLSRIPSRMAAWRHGWEARTARRLPCTKTAPCRRRKMALLPAHLSQDYALQWCTGACSGWSRESQSVDPRALCPRVDVVLVPSAMPRPLPAASPSGSASRRLRQPPWSSR